MACSSSYNCVCFVIVPKVKLFVKVRVWISFSCGRTPCIRTPIVSPIRNFRWQISTGTSSFSIRSSDIFERLDCKHSFEVLDVLQPRGRSGGRSKVNLYHGFGVVCHAGCVKGKHPSLLLCSVKEKMKLQMFNRSLSVHS